MFRPRRAGRGFHTSFTLYTYIPIYTSLLHSPRCLPGASYALFHLSLLPTPAIPASFLIAPSSMK
ncbi:hypothetical protein BDW68DRAFT_150017 [Aspergillus falconensis]